MRNIFDQYEQQENRVTHALFSSLNEDPKLLVKFLKEVVQCPPPRARRLIVEEQRLPGEAESDEAEAERRGLPDAWIHDGENWCVLVESKVAAPLNLGQLARHRAMAERRGFDSIHILVITARDAKGPLPRHVQAATWSEIYVWLQGQRSGSGWARRAAQYLEVAEARMVDSGYLKEGTLTKFPGFTFGAEQPYSYTEAKRLLRLAIEELRRRRDLQRVVEMDPTGEGRPAITGKVSDSVWDFIPLKRARSAAAFTEYPHLTLSIRADGVRVMVTIPHAIATRFRRNLTALGEDGFFSVVQKVEKNLRPVLRKAPGAAPWITAVQRHYPSQRSSPINDAWMEFDLRTAARPRSRRSQIAVKLQPEWLQAAYGALARKSSNYQIAIGAVFPFRTCPAIGRPTAVDRMAETWISCKPILDVMLG